MSRREFQLTEGSSNKFWAIRVEGSEFTVEFGRVGTRGQSQTKEFASDAAARQAADKLIAEKTKKGYQEVGGAASPAASPAAAPVKAKAKTKKQAAEPIAAATAQATPSAPAALKVERVIALDPEDWYRATWRPRHRLDVPQPIPHHELIPELSRLFREDVQAKDLLAILKDDLLESFYCNSSIDAVAWLGGHLFPYLSDDVLTALREQLRPRINPNRWPSDEYKWPAMTFFLASLSGMHEEVRAVVESWPDAKYQRERWNRFRHLPQQMVFGLGDPQLVVQQARRIRMPLERADHFRAWLAHTELDGLDYIREEIQGRQKKSQAAEAMKLFVDLVNAPEMAPHVLELRINSNVPAQARQWLDANRGNAIVGLIPIAAGRGKLADAAIDFLREAKQQGHGAFIQEQLKSTPAEIANRIRQEVLERVEVVRQQMDEATTPNWLRASLKGTRVETALPSWISLTNLPPVTIGEHCLNDNQVSAVLSALRSSPLGKATPLVQAIKEHVAPAVRDAFVWKLFEMWLGEGAPSKEKWALLAIGHLGDNGAVLKLTPLLRAWPGESQHQRAVLGLECLRAVGSDTALMQLNGVAQKLKFQGLKKKAQEFMEAIAKDRGMSRTQLEDRIVPDLDLDERGTRVFDFGPRQFTVVLDAELKPMVRDEAGKLKSDLPKPGARDEADKANAALADWKILKKQLREVIKVQAYRLEQAMVTGRCWNIQEFEQLLVHHPLMINLVRRLVWGGHDKQGKLARTFRVTEEREYTDSHDERATLDGLVTVGIVHPVNLSEDDRAAWGQTFGDYEIIAPFPQLSRPVMALEQDEQKQSALHRFAKVKIPGGAYLGTMEKLGWTRGSASDHGVIQEFFKQFLAADVTAIVENEDGIPLGLGPDSFGDQRMTCCSFLRGQFTAETVPYPRKPLPLKDIDAVTLSEVLSDLTTLASKGK